MDREKRRTELTEQFANAPIGAPQNVVSELAESSHTADPAEIEPDIGDYTGKNTPADDALEGDVEPVEALGGQTEAEEKAQEAEKALENEEKIAGHRRVTKPRAGAVKRPYKARGLVIQPESKARF